MPFENLAVLQSLGGDPDIAGSQLARAAAAEAVADAADERQAQSRRAAAEDRAETLALADRQWGNPLGEMRRHQMELPDLQDRVSDLRAQLAKAEKRLDSCRSSLTWWSERAFLADAGAQRSRVPDELEQAHARAAEALRGAAEGRMVVERARRAVARG